MGSYYTFEVSPIFIPAEKVPAMLDALMLVAQGEIRAQKGYELSRKEADANNEQYGEEYRHQSRKGVDELRILLEELPNRVLPHEEILNNLQWSLTFDEASNLTSLYHGESKHADFDELEAMAPFMPDGAYIEVRGEDRDDLYRKVFRDGKMKHVQAVISFPEEEKLFAVSVAYRRGSGSKHAYEEVHLLKAKSSEAAQKILHASKEGTEDTEDFEYEVEEVDFQILERGDSQPVFGHYHN